MLLQWAVDDDELARAASAEQLSAEPSLDSSGRLGTLEHGQSPPWVTAAEGQAADAGEQVGSCLNL